MLLEQGSEGKGKAKSLRTNRGDTPLAISDLLQRQFNPPMALMVDDSVEEEDDKEKQEIESKGSSGGDGGSGSGSKGKAELVDGVMVLEDDDDDDDVERKEVQEEQQITQGKSKDIENDFNSEQPDNQKFRR